MTKFNPQHFMIPTELKGPILVRPPFTTQWATGEIIAVRKRFGRERFYVTYNVSWDGHDSFPRWVWVRKSQIVRTL